MQIHTFVSNYICLPAWIGFTSAEDKSRLQKIINKAEKWRLGGGIKLPALSTLCEAAENKLFAAATTNSSHVLHKLLPEKKLSYHNLRQRRHNYILPIKTTLNFCNFIVRMLYCDIY